MRPVTFRLLIIEREAHESKENHREPHSRVLRYPMPVKQPPELQPSEIQERIMANLDVYANRSSFECFALLMGKAQILEFGLKSLLARLFFVNPTEMEKWTLGRVANELESKGLRGDYVALLKKFVEHRNHIAHEILVCNAIFRSMEAGISARFEFKQLQDPAWELERLLILHDWCEESGAWLPLVNA